ncbi:Zn-binding protein [Aliidiomarina shirensis]|uniref:UPF0225 protein CWE13_02210 n=1 Tax=Aliidiomarina shirensis TaxID=1048642 RepID=A0A432WXI9_9GAMM|nr:YchJ family metal-binding protein [Aliidiomarina shirensis]RUO38475.1 Zn-binding protein [Aliidiomarina shirensis]
MLEEASCPCGSEKSYAQCCGVFHQGGGASTPELLMRSRYTAFVKGNIRYLQETWHPSTRPPLDLDGNPEWVKLQILESWQRNTKGYVHFRAFYQEQGVLQMMEEKSKFVYENGCWFYVEPENLKL